MKLRRGLLAFLIAGGAMCGCGGTPTGAPSSKMSPTPSATGSTRELAAKEIDPGPVEPLGPRYPTSFRELLDKATPSGDRVAAARELVARLERAQERGRSRIDDGMLADVLDAIHGLEPIAFGTSSTNAAEAADLLAFLYTLGRVIENARGSIPRGLRNERESALDQAGFSKAIELLKDGDRLARAMAARSLRGAHPVHAFDTLARVRADRGDFEGAKQARLEHLKHSGETPSTFDRLAVAHSCIVALDVACAEEQLARAKEVSSRDGVEAMRGIDSAAARLERARTFLKTRSGKTYEERLANARSAIVLDRHDIAAKELPKLAMEAPDDARPLVYQARLRLLQGPNLNEDVLREASALVDRARTRSKKDEEFYDASLALRGYLFSFDLAKAMGSATTDEDRAVLVERFAEHLRAPVREVAARDASRGEPLEYLIEVLIGAAKVQASPSSAVIVREKFRDAADRAVVIARKHPKTYEAVAVGRAFGALSRKRDVSLAALDLPWPNGAATFNHVRSALTQRVVLGAAWDAVDRIPQEDEIMDGVEETDDEAGLAHVLAADAEAARAFRMTDAKSAARAWKSAGEALLRAFGRAPEDQRVRIINNAAVAFARSGDEDGARTLLAKLDRVNDAIRELVALNKAALSVGKNVDEAQSALADVFAKSGDPEIAEEAARWLATVALKKNDRAGAKKAAEQAIAKKADAARVGGVRLTTRKSLVWNFGLAPARENLAALEVRIDHWAVWELAAPITDAELQNLAGPPKPVPKK